MSWLRSQIRSLERRYKKGDTVEIPQENGLTERFTTSDLRDAFEVCIRRSRGEDIEPHPLTLAARSSDNPRWSGSFLAKDGSEFGEVEDLSEW